MKWLSERRVSAVALVMLSALAAYVWRLPYPQTEWLERGYDVLPSHLAWAVSALWMVWAVVFAFEPTVRGELRASGALPLVVAFAGISSAATMWVLPFDQPQRFAQPVMGLTFALMVLSASGGLAVLLALDGAGESPTRRMRRYAWVMALVVLVVMLTAGAVTIGRFPRMNDFFDEIFGASMMTHYVETGDFCPSLSDCAFGDNSPFFARWLMWNGVWARLLGRVDLLALRSFNLLAGGVLVALTAFGMRWAARADGLAVTVGAALMASMTVFVRSSHTLRMDIGLGFYGAALVFGLMLYDRWRDERRGLWAIGAAGAGFIFGLETVPTVSLMLGVSVGLMLIVWALVHRTGWRAVFVYAGGAALASALYLVVRFLPDAATQWGHFRGMQAAYVTMGSVGTGQPVSVLTAMHRFSVVMSPAEVLTVYAALVGLTWMGTRFERWLLVAVGVAQLGTAALFGGSFGYQMVFLSVAVYAAVRVVTRWRGALLVGVFVLLPSVASPMLHDMVGEYREDINGRLIAELDLLTWRIPEGATVVAPDVFWLTLYEKAHVIGQDTNIMVTQANDISREELLTHLAPNVVVCRTDLPSESWLCDLAADYFDTPPEPFVITMGPFDVYGLGD